MSQPSISQHLRKLKEGGIIQETKKEQWVYYSLDKQAEIYPFIESILQHVTNQKALLDKLKENSPLRQKCCE